MRLRKEATRLVMGAGLLVTCSVASGADYDEAIDGDLGDQANGPTIFDVDLGTNTVSGTVGDDGSLDEDFISFTIGAGEGISAITLEDAMFTGGNTSTGFRLYADLGSGLEQVAPGSFTLGDIGTNYLNVWDLSDVGGSAPLGPGTYGVLLAEFTPGQEYTFSIEVVPAPGSMALLGFGALAAGRRRR
jgi:hypothetical protein